MFSNYRSAHHPDAARRLKMATAVFTDSADDDVPRRTLRWRDRWMWLEMESSSLAGTLIASLQQACPNKKFILTIRDPYSWCNSWIDHNLNRPGGETSPWVIFDRIRLRVDDYPPNKHDAPLTACGMPSLASFFQMWTEHNTRVLDAVPPARLLVVRTSEIIERSTEIATWCGVARETLATDQAWLNASPTKHEVLSRLDPSYVRETAETYCGPLMTRFFPEVEFAPGGPASAPTESSS